MMCVKCGARTQIYDTRVDDKHGLHGWVRRRRECNECGHRFKTTEMTDDELLQSQKEDDGEED
jgi:transcriptional regulator NrdR family protein